ncbi:dephospho-CoA kinase [Helicobacter sp. MIT 05-5294]|uniref:dephospho-CoA kinase n=1 Tax=Helicobacter sp. MIT 05-5294 TaxID=1548150 RepID=UPI0010FCE85B|nr:dephospho-CoA kinase [Helicobacter sp. MIT 05-5294]TLD86989.1 dephospho-CoA kinase [Helicobacter sp. MIT 05-5294]
MNLSLAIALTGGIASGKSTAASLLKLYGYHIICADEIAHQKLESSAEEVVRAFGEGILKDRDLDSSKIDRQKLGAIVFSNKNARQKLESILHPKIREEILSQAQMQESKGIPYFVDIPLFFETNSYPISRSLLIYTTKELQLKRLQERNHLSEEEALKRIESQISLEDKRVMASDVIENYGTLEELQSAIESYLRTL